MSDLPPTLPIATDATNLYRATGVFAASPVIQSNGTLAACVAFAERLTGQAQTWWAQANRYFQDMRRALQREAEREMVKYRLFQVAAGAVPRLPLWLARPLFWWGGMLGWALAPAVRRRTAFNLGHVVGCDDPARLRTVTRQAFGHLALNYLDFFRGAAIPDAELVAGWEVENEELLHAAMQQGRGMIVLTGHFGAFEQAMSRLGAFGYPMLSPAERMKPEALFALFLRLRTHHNVRLLPGDSRETLREMVSALKRNEIVLFAVDRYVLGQSLYAPFFGAPARLPITPILFALRNDAPVMMLTAWREEGGRTHGFVQPLDLHGAVAAFDATCAEQALSDLPSAEARARQRDGRLLAALRVVTEALEGVISRRPEQWASALSPIWDASFAVVDRISGEEAQTAISANE